MKPGQTGMRVNGHAGENDLRGRAFGMSPAPQPPMFDAELGQIFLKMRLLLGLGLWDMARQVGAEPTSIADLEAGAIDSLPPWPELNRLVSAYAALTGVDPQPILSRLMRALGLTQPTEPATLQRRLTAVTAPPVAIAGAHAPARGQQTGPGQGRRPAPATAATVNAPAPAQDAEVVGAPPRKAQTVSRAAASIGRGVRSGLRRHAVKLAALLMIPAALAIVGRTYPAAFYSIVSPLPSAVGSPLRGMVDHWVATLAPVRDGLTWIDVGDPQIRKTDKLREHSR